MLKMNFLQRVEDFWKDPSIGGSMLTLSNNKSTKQALLQERQGNRKLSGYREENNKNIHDAQSFHRTKRYHSSLSLHKSMVNVNHNVNHCYNQNNSSYSKSPIKNNSSSHPKSSLNTNPPSGNLPDKCFIIVAPTGLPKKQVPTLSLLHRSQSGIITSTNKTNNLVSIKNPEEPEHEDRLKSGVVKLRERDQNNLPGSRRSMNFKE